MGLRVERAALRVHIDAVVAETTIADRPETSLSLRLGADENAKRFVSRSSPLDRVVHKR
jgi:hypothetical protein